MVVGTDELVFLFIYILCVLCTETDMEVTAALHNHQENNITTRSLKNNKLSKKQYNFEK